MTGVSFDPDAALPTQGEAASEEHPPHVKKSTLFHLMAANPWPWLVIMPAIYIALIGSGWSQDDYIEEEVSRIWIPTDGNYYQDQQYASSFDRNDLGRTGFAAMAIARDGGNLFTKERLEEIRDRMEKTEATTVEFKNQTYTWDDVCALNNVGLGTAYEFPCARLSPMDLFQEARWFFDEVDKVTWHQDLIHGSLVRPRIPRFGVMQANCAAECGELMRLRMDAAFAEEQGYPPGYANPLSLFADIGNMELNDPCRACIDENFETTLTDILVYATQALGVLKIELERYEVELLSGELTAELENVQGLIKNLETIIGGLTKREIEDFYRMYVTRGLYAQLGTIAYLEGYGRLEQLLQVCQAPLVCPPVTITPNEAAAQLLAHADNTFSSITTAGSPLPFWDQANGTGFMFEGSLPVSGSGVDMSADFRSLIAYLDLSNYGQANWAPLYEGGSAGFADPTFTTWIALVDVNPVYAWFMAGETPADDVCGNGDLKGTRTGQDPIDTITAGVAAASTQDWCTKFSVPTSVEGAVQDEDTTYTKQDFASMWYNLMIDSPSFLDITQGVDDPYSWTTGQGCGYELQGERDAYMNQTEDDILLRASRELYYVDEGESVGVVDRNLLIGDVSPAIGDYSSENPLTEVGVIQSLYAALLPPDIVERVKNCNRPGGPLEISEDDGEQILRLYKETMEDTWSKDWDDKDAGEVQFVGFYDDSGVIGTTGRLLKNITLDNNKLTAITIILIMFFSAIFLFSSDLIESKMLVTLVGVALVVLAFFAAVGLAILIGIKINITIAWTLPFIIIGLGVDDVYIVLIALKKQKGYHEQSFLKAMKEVVVPVTMTSAVNCCCFAVLTASDIPAVYLTAQVATICIIALYLAVIFCYPAYCYLDMKRQAANRYDVIFCKKRRDEDGADTEEEEEKPDFRNVWLFDEFYKPIILGTNKSTRCVFHSIVTLGAIAMTACGVWGITEREVGLGLEDFFPYNHQAKRWATVRTAELASWSIGMNWGALDYNDGDTQMKMIKQFEDVVATEHVAEIDTKFLWVADMALWSTRQCDENFNQDDPSVSECGRDQLFDGVSEQNCEGAWVRNKFDLRVKNFQDPKGECQPNEAGICRPSSQMFLADLEASGWDPVMDNQTTWCPIMDWPDDKFQYCLKTWRNITNFSGGRFVMKEDSGTENPTCNGEFYRDTNTTWPMPYSAAPSMFSFDLTSHELTLEMMAQTREVCDQNEELHCWMTGIPYDYWTQYQGIFGVLTQLAGYATAIGFAVSFVFLYGKLKLENRYSNSKILTGSIVGALLIALTMILSLISVIGLSVLAGVSLTGFSNMAFVLSVGFAVEYSVHVVSRWLRAPNIHESAMDRVDYTMSFLMLPTFMSFISSTIGVVCLAFTEFEFNSVFFFTPLIITMMVTYFFGVWWLPTTLCYLDYDVLKLGKNDTRESLYLTTSLAKAKFEGDDLDELRAVANEGDEVMEETNNVPEDSASDHSPPAEDTAEENSGEDDAVKDVVVKGGVSAPVKI